jgi:polysaccharide biosynthesis protein PslH
MKRILLISRCPPYPLHLGDRLIIYHLARELSQRGYAIDLLAFANRPEDWDKIPQYQQYFQHVALFHEPRRRQFDYLKRALLPSTRWPRKAEDSWSPDMWRAIEAQLAANHYDVVHVFGGIQVYEYRYALGDTPAIIVPYESYSLYLHRMVEAAVPYFLPLSVYGEGAGGRGFLNHLQLYLARHFERWMFAPYKRVVVVSQRDNDELLALNPELKIEVIPNGIDLSYFQPQNRQREPATLLFVGNYEYAPNVDAALRLAREILPEAQTQIPSANLWLVGHAPPPEVHALASDTITVTGSVPDVRPYLAQATAFVSPLRLGAGIKNKVLEALAMGCPVVATPLSVDGIDVQHERDVLIAEGSAMIDAIVGLLQAQDLQRRLSKNGPKLIAERYSWARVATLYEDLYHEVSG